MQQIEIDHIETDTGVPVKRIWRFQLDYFRDILILMEYLEMRRPSNRHKWRITCRYHRTRIRSGDETYEIITVDFVPFPQSVIDEAKQKLFDQITVVK